MIPRASFVIPVFNMDRWISSTIWSCRNQIIKQIEIIVVNDASTDMSKDIIDEHAKNDPRIKVVHLPENHGQSFCRNEGNKLAQSDFIFVLDGDDMAARNRVKDSLVTFQLKGADVVYGSWFKIDSGGVVREKALAMPFDMERNRKDRTNHICHSTMAYRKKVAMAVSYQFEDFGSLGIDDWRFTWDVYKAGYKFYAMRQYLSYYRALDGSMTKTRDPSKMNEIKDSYLAAL